MKQQKCPTRVRNGRSIKGPTTHPNATIFTTRVAGIPCQCKVDMQTVPAITDAQNFQFELLDRKGYKAPWLERKLDPVITEELYDDYLTYLESA